MSADIAQAAAAYARFWAELTPESAARVAEVAAPGIEFRDPFNHVHGHAGLAAVIAKTFADCEAPRFTITRIACVERVAYLQWRFSFRPKGGRGGEPWLIEGVSEVHFDAAGLATRHIDHWDAAGQLYERLPLLGAALRFVKRRMKV